MAGNQIVGSRIEQRSDIKCLLAEKCKPDQASTPGMVDSVNPLILAIRRVTIEDTSKQFGISLDKVHKTGHNDFTFSKVIRH